MLHHFPPVLVPIVYCCVTTHPKGCHFFLSVPAGMPGCAGMGSVWRAGKERERNKFQAYLSHVILKNLMGQVILPAHCR